MGNHRVAAAGPRGAGAGPRGAGAGQNGAGISQYGGTGQDGPGASQYGGPRALGLRNWPVSTRLIAVIVLALLMGLVFGGLRVASATDSADEFGRVSQPADL